MKRNFRLTKARDFTHIKKEGRTRHHKFVVLVFIPNNMEYSRAAFVASKSVGNAVIRNLVKRRMKACIANSWNNVKPGWDMVFYAKATAAMAGYNDLQKAVSSLISKAGLVTDK
ncbi:MAG: ribonuclease P protein component [Anaerolineaceae bacterium]|nr:ribonuclease P protein component [Anaerolineaceae bacterium]